MLLISNYNLKVYHNVPAKLPSKIPPPALFFLKETNPNPSLPEKDGADEARETTAQEIVSPEAYIKHPLQNRQDSMAQLKI